MLRSLRNTIHLSRYGVPDVATVLRGHLMRFYWLLFFLISVSSFGQSGFHKNPIIYHPLTPTAVAPGGSDFTLRVMGNGFDFESVAYWNSTPLTTTILGTRFLTAIIPASLTATAQ